MSDPRFSVGDLVAVCTRGCGVVIPVASVTEAVFVSAGDVLIGPSGEFLAKSDCWTCVVSESNAYFGEGCLRPLLPGDYLTTEDESELSPSLVLDGEKG